METYEVRADSYPFGLVVVLPEIEDETVEKTSFGVGAHNEQLDDMTHSCVTAFEKKKENKRDYELEQLSKHVREFKKEFNDPVSLKMLEVTLKTNAMLVRGDYE